LKPALAAGGSVTAGNSSQMSDGAAAVVLMSEAALKRHDLQPLGRFAGYAVAGVLPDVMGIGPVQAIPAVLRQTGLGLSGIEGIELNEAFAARSLAVVREPDLDPARTNPLGGAPARRHQDDPRGDAAPWPAPSQTETRRGQHVHRHWHGRSRRIRGRMNAQNKPLKTNTY
jgi:acetyl-CoA acetyltransferase